jgi:hypothetical protein
MLDAVMRFQTILVKEDVDAATYQVQPADIVFHLDLLAKEAAEPIVDSGADAALGAAPEAPAAAPAAEAEGDDAESGAEEAKVEAAPAAEPAVPAPAAEKEGGAS